MPTVALKNGKINAVTVVKKMKDYSEEPVFKKKLEKAKEFIEKNGLPKGFAKKK